MQVILAMQKRPCLVDPGTFGSETNSSQAIGLGLKLLAFYIIGSQTILQNCCFLNKWLYTISLNYSFPNFAPQISDNKVTGSTVNNPQTISPVR
jgi:hypothetical protein